MNVPAGSQGEKGSMDNRIKYAVAGRLGDDDRTGREARITRLGQELLAAIAALIAQVRRPGDVQHPTSKANRPNQAGALTRMTWAIH